MILSNNDQPRIRITLKDVREKRPGGGFRGMRVNHVDVGFGRLQMAQVRRKHGLQLLRDDLEGGLLQYSFKFAQHQLVRRKDAYTQF